MRPMSHKEYISIERVQLYQVEQRNVTVTLNLFAALLFIT